MEILVKSIFGYHLIHTLHKFATLRAYIFLDTFPLSYIPVHLSNADETASAQRIIGQSDDIS